MKYVIDKTFIKVIIYNHLHKEIQFEKDWFFEGEEIVSIDSESEITLGAEIDRFTFKVEKIVGREPNPGDQYAVKYIPLDD